MQETTQTLESFHEMMLRESVMQIKYLAEQGVAKSRIADLGTTGWAVAGNGILYVGYNLAVYPAVLFTLHRVRSRRESAVAALVSGILMTVPFSLSYLALMAFYPDPAVMDAPVPWLPMLQSVGGPLILGIFGLVMGWTLLETSVGLIHALLSRVNKDLRMLGPLSRTGGLSRLQNGLLGAGILIAAAFLSRVGIIDLVARGYTLMGYAFIVLFAIPLLTVGAWKVFRRAPDDGSLASRSGGEANRYSGMS